MRALELLVIFILLSQSVSWIKPFTKLSLLLLIIFWEVSSCSYCILCYDPLLLLSALLCKIAALRSFSLDKLHYWRESASGMSSSACFLAKDTIDIFNILVKPLVYLSMFYFFTNPRSTFFDNYIVLVCLVYCVTGIAYALAIFLQPSTAQLVSFI